jgi:hypothetical protein
MKEALGHHDINLRFRKAVPADHPCANIAQQEPMSDIIPVD